MTLFSFPSKTNKRQIRWSNNNWIYNSISSFSYGIGKTRNIFQWFVTDFYFHLAHLKTDFNSWGLNLKTIMSCYLKVVILMKYCFLRNSGYCIYLTTKCTRNLSNYSNWMPDENFTTFLEAALGEWIRSLWIILSCFYVLYHVDPAISSELQMEIKDFNECCVHITY